MRYAPEECHEPMQDAACPDMSFSPGENLTAWQKRARPKLRELLGWSPAPGALDLEIEYDRIADGFRERRFHFTAEPGADVPGYLLTPLDRKPPFPVMLCLQGHTTGMHLSLGRPKVWPDEETTRIDRLCVEELDQDFGVQAVRRGFASLCIEQRCFGERSDGRSLDRRLAGTQQICHHASLNALMFGRTVIGERVYDAMRAIDLAATFDDLDITRLGCMGHSGGATITIYAAALDERIRATMPSGYVCNFRSSLGHFDHCECNYIPNLLRHFECADIVLLAAPRPVVVVASADDAAFPVDGVHDAYERIRSGYTSAGAADKCRLFVGSGGHRFFADEAWPRFEAVTGWGR